MVYLRMDTMFEWHQPGNMKPMTPTLKQIITATSAGIILFIIDYFVLCNNK